MNSHITHNSLTSNFNIVQKIAFGFLAAAAMALVGTAGMAGAQTVPTSKNACKNGGWQQLGYRNQGQCIKAFNQSQHGYGGQGGNGGGSSNNEVNANVDIALNNSDDNIITIIIRFLFG
jgi:hypothetical protein